MLVAMISANPNLMDKNDGVFPSFVNTCLFFLFLWKQFFYTIISLLNRINRKNIIIHETIIDFAASSMSYVNDGRKI